VSVILDHDSKVFLNLSEEVRKNEVLMKGDVVVVWKHAQELFPIQREIVLFDFTFPVVVVTILEEPVDHALVVLDRTPSLLELVELFFISLTVDLGYVVDVSLAVHTRAGHHVSDNDVVKTIIEDSIPESLNIVSGSVAVDLVDDRGQENRDLSLSSKRRNSVRDVTPVGGEVVSDLRVLLLGFLDHVFRDVKAIVDELRKETSKKVNESSVGTAIVDENMGIDFVDEEHLVHHRLLHASVIDCEVSKF